MKVQASIFGILLILFFVFIVVLIGAFVSKTAIGFFPTNSIAQNTMKVIYNSVFGIFDNSIIFIVLILFIGDVAYSYLHPSKARGFLNILLLFGLFYVWLAFNTFTFTINNVFSANTLLPNFYLVFSNHYTLYLLMVFSALSIIFSFRGNRV